jgi:pSer/pThr/pTyr-binding forkhead associated (FHA) protein
MSTPSDITAGLQPPALLPDAECIRLSAVVNGQRRIAETEHPVTIIGSRRDCALSLPHPSVGKLHAAIVHLGDRVVLCDLRGREDTRVNGAAVERITLTPDMEVQIGEVAVSIEFPEGTQLSPNAPEAIEMTLLEDDVSYEINQAITVIGRWKACNVVLDTQDVSLSHALIFPLYGQVAISDLGSRSGVEINGEACHDGWLSGEDQIQIGAHTLQVLADIRVAHLTDEQCLHLVHDESEQDVFESESREEHEFVEVADLGSTLASPAMDDSGSDDLDDLSSSLARLREQFSQARTTLSEQAAEIREQAARLAARESQLEVRMGQMASREQALSEREQREAHAAQQLAQFRNALQEASSVFASYVPPDGDADGEHVTGDLPAPMVNGALFDAAGNLQGHANSFAEGGRRSDHSTERPMAIAN